MRLLPALRQQERHGQQQRQRRQGDKRPAQGAAVRVAQCRQRRQSRHQRHAVPPAGIGDVGFQRERAAEDGNRALQTASASSSPLSQRCFFCPNSATAPVRPNTGRYAAVEAQLGASP
ncbi:MAG: hypothetical protein ACLUHE_02235 [Christensenellales bacterium]